MAKNKSPQQAILVIGETKIACSVAVCLLLSDTPVTLVSQDPQGTMEAIHAHAENILNAWDIKLNSDLLIISTTADYGGSYKLAIAVSAEDLSVKKNLIASLENLLPEDTIIAVNSESILLSAIQSGSKCPGRIIGANWVEPAHTTFFLEIISNQTTEAGVAERLFAIAKNEWKKDPYIVNTDYSIRARLLSALIREAFYLVENGYVSIEDIDRACRNDAGYYLPFAGNFRYMDLMGTYIYGIVMKDMNPSLTKQQHTPAFFNELIERNCLGMESKSGFYDYPNGEVERWSRSAADFSYQLKEIVDKYQPVINARQ
jgi:3-hydroxybutyryl-CoA dehydrogenase